MDLKDLFCQRCFSTNCKLWYKLYFVSHVKQYFYCLQCFVERKELLLPFKDRIDLLFGNISIPELKNKHIEFVPRRIGEFSPAILDENFNLISHYQASPNQINDWENLPSFPEFWKFGPTEISDRKVEINNNRLQILIDNLYLNLSRLGLTKASIYWFCSSANSEVNLRCTIDKKEYLFSIPEAFHLLFWIKNLSSISESTFDIISSKIKNKYK